MPIEYDLKFFNEMIDYDDDEDEPFDDEDGYFNVEEGS